MNTKDIEISNSKRPEGSCPIYKKCGGCQLQNMTYEKQLLWKQSKVEQLLSKFCYVDKIIGMKNPRNYRNKVQAAYGMTRDNKVISGVYQSTTMKIVPTDKCMTEDIIADKIIVDIRNMLTPLGIVPYNEYNGNGLLRHVLVKRGFATNEVMVVFVGSNPIFPQKKLFVQELLKKHPEITTIIFNINSDRPSMLLGDREHILYGKGFIEDIMCGCRFKISAKSFYQINPIQTEILYNKAMDFAQLTGCETVIDAYCGIGTIGLIASSKAKEVIGVEINKDAVKDAILNTKLNSIKNARFFCYDAGKFMREMADEKEKCDVVFMDPPRAGSDKEFLSALIVLFPPKIVYISCNPETLERDLLFLTQNGYKVTKIQPVDMFPHTNHVECVVLMTKNK
ncbi:MAG: 23S rRNA (uracil(1939)-C(5))-methyltransferase RlmD [Oscillospiraceae bacterium]